MFVGGDAAAAKRRGGKWEIVREGRRTQVVVDRAMISNAIGRRLAFNSGGRGMHGSSVPKRRNAFLSFEKQ